MFHPKGFWPYTGSERRFCAISQQWKEMGVDVLALEPDPIAKNGSGVMAHPAYCDAMQHTAG